MNCMINKNHPVSIKDQLKTQIRGMLNSQHKSPGQTFPSCNDMSVTLPVNRNTFATLYTDLSTEGFRTTNRGAGIIDSNSAIPQPADTLFAVIANDFSRAKDSND